MSQLQEKLKQLPSSPGVYFFRDSKGKILYIGKASILKRRVSSYFQKNHRDYKTPLLVEKITDVDWVVTQSEMDALFLEAEFIKRHKPLYNVREKDDKNFIFVRISMQDDFPSVSLVRRPADDRSRYFGPFINGYGVRQALKYLRKVFPYFVRDKQKYSSKLEYQIGVLPKPDIPKKDYRAQITKLTMVLEGKSSKLIGQIEKELKSLAAQKRYEEAAKLRDQYLALKALSTRIVFGNEEKIVAGLDQALEELAKYLGLQSKPRRIECYDISNFAGGDSVASMVVFSDGLPDTRAYRHFKMRTKGPNDFAMMQETLTRRFSTRNVKWPKPELIIVDGGKGQLSSAKKVLAEMGINIPIVGLAKRYETIIMSRDDFVKQPDFGEDKDYYTLNFESDSALLHLLQRTRDEAHRFAVSYHTKVRARRVKKSLLDDIAGVGPATRKKLIKKFGSVLAIKEASTEELSAEVGLARAKLIRQALG